MHLEMLQKEYDINMYSVTRKDALVTEFEVSSTFLHHVTTFNECRMGVGHLREAGVPERVTSEVPPLNLHSHFHNFLN